MRYATLADCSDLAALDARVFGELGYPSFVLIQMIELCEQNVEVVHADGRAVGYCFASRAHGTDHGWIFSLGVERAFRHRGLGRRLTVRALERLAIEGARVARLTVDPDNSAAVGLYRSLGFEVVESASGYFGEGQDRLLMERVLRTPDRPRREAGLSAIS